MPSPGAPLNRVWLSGGHAQRPSEYSLAVYLGHLLAILNGFTPFPRSPRHPGRDVSNILFPRFERIFDIFEGVTNIFEYIRSRRKSRKNSKSA